MDSLLLDPKTRDFPPAFRTAAAATGAAGFDRRDQPP
jgi:hypothetical protein